MATGTIKRIARDKGFGFIRDNSGQEYFFHRSSVQGSFDSLSEGQRVSLRRGAVAQGPARGQRSTPSSQQSVVGSSVGRSPESAVDVAAVYFRAAGVSVVSRLWPSRM